MRNDPLERPTRDIFTMIKVMRVFAMVALLMSTAARAVEPTVDSEIEQLLAWVAASGCGFERNGDRYTSKEAADHLSLKYRRGARYVSTTEDFIDRLASQSSWTGKPYHVICDGIEMQSGPWLHRHLAALRATPQSP